MFWRHTYTSWDEIESPSQVGIKTFHGLTLDWNRFVTDQTTDFFKAETEALIYVNPDVKITTNFFAGKGENEEIIPLVALNYAKFEKAVDVVSQDADRETLEETACRTAFMHEQFYSFQNKPFLILKCSLINVVHYDYNRSKRQECILC